MTNEETTIQVNRKLKTKLDHIKLYPRESYGDVIARLIEAEASEERELSPATIKHIEQSLEEIKAGKFVTFEDVKKKAGL